MEQPTYQKSPAKYIFFLSQDGVTEQLLPTNIFARVILNSRI